jgi:hypothetical protein
VERPIDPIPKPTARVVGDLRGQTSPTCRGRQVSRLLKFASPPIFGIASPAGFIPAIAFVHWLSGFWMSS